MSSWTKKYFRGKHVYFTRLLSFACHVFSWFIRKVLENIEKRKIHSASSLHLSHHFLSSKSTRKSRKNPGENTQKNARIFWRKILKIQGKSEMRDKILKKNCLHQYFGFSKNFYSRPFQLLGKQFEPNKN